MAITKTGVLIDTDQLFQNPLVFEVDGKQNSVPVNGLSPDTTYYTMGYVINDGVRILSRNTRTFVTPEEREQGFYISNTDTGPVTVMIKRFGTVPLDSTLRFDYTTDDGVTWNYWESGGSDLSITLDVGEDVRFTGYEDNAFCDGGFGGSGSDGGAQGYRFTFDGRVNVYGNIMFLVDPTGESTVINKPYCFTYIFANANTATFNLTLPATVLKVGCYEGSFRRCELLTKAPDLPARSVPGSAYNSMFAGCTALVDPPMIAATGFSISGNGYNMASMFSGCTSLIRPPQINIAVMKRGCYEGMFYNCSSLEEPMDFSMVTTLEDRCFTFMFGGCTSLVSVPNDMLPWNTLKKSCYTRMFYGCTSLINAPRLPALVLPESDSSYPDTNMGVYCGMFEGCTSLITAPELPSTLIAGYSYQSMFAGCSSLRYAPILPAPVLKKKSYCHMFDGCTSLNNVTTYAEDISADNCTTGWLNNVSNSGTLYNFGKAAFTTNSASGVPVGWTEKKYDYFNIKNLSTTQNAISLSKTGAPSDITLEYSKDKDTWTEWSSVNGDLRLIIEDGETVWFRGNNSTFNGDSSYYKFSAFFDIAVGGNCMSLLDKTMQPSTLPSYAFARLFSGCTALKQISDILPATSLMVGCYQYMFQGCTGLTSLPSGLLPATSFNGYTSCYMSMFQGCTGLTSLPSGLLPATTLEALCYMSMFQGCTGLTSLPSGLLPATTLESQCYTGMFRGCTGLTSLPSGLLPATSLSDYCYDGMFRGCTGLTSLPSGLLPATSLSMYCYQNMFYGCTSITEIELPAPTPYYGCYNNMLRGCSSLNKIICYTADLSSSYSSNWVNGAGNGSGDFYNLSGSTIPTGNNGIPTGWTEHTSL